MDVEKKRMNELEVDVERWKSNHDPDGPALKTAHLKITQMTPSQTSTTKQLEAAQRKL